jgi:hypothetical protein
VTGAIEAGSEVTGIGQETKTASKKSASKSKITPARGKTATIKASIKSKTTSPKKSAKSSK